MKATITSIQLKTPFHFFALSANALKIIRQLQATNCVAFRKRGIWKTHYTMTLWNSEVELKQFSASGAHLKAMQLSRKIAVEIRTITIEADTLPDWKVARKLLANAKVHRYEK